ncbi:MAG: (d)CMP kinase [Burkholderiales bacterium]|nr:(d)CMP kinase [Burkholderiales bacterium]
MVSVITIDGPASSGKGTVAKIVANKLGFYYLESGAIYRALGFWVNKNVNGKDVNVDEIVALIDSMDLSFNDGEVLLNSEVVTMKLRDEYIGMLASKYGSIAEVRAKLLQFQRNFAKTPGLVTDGRDMGSIVFPDAKLKIFLTASASTRAERRYKQLQQFDKTATIEGILQDIISRDEQDSSRSTAPLSYDSTFELLDNSDMTVDETVNRILELYITR